ncbi:ABC transporter substrate-binding protein [Bradyrhizobium sp. NP1]|uniref:ABC transporter substrate-binding protein n=1 Tax=Bradyrhizobium sp. NP1 TaxID=3049772 RepID=UPI0025A5C367|nr:ABC transporter substrate-binding protein [Bradyrhizobium sp. NP1]WJR77291.1 ABC transporter substrate-binding protein [Bradyrhizobium sp. NP1]
MDHRRKRGSARRALLRGFAGGCFALLLGGAVLGTSAAHAEQVVRIGALYPLSGAVAKSGEDTLNAVKLAVDVINGKYPDSHLPFAKPGGLPGLGGARIELVAADHQASPEVGAAEAERMITQQKVAALIGTFLSSVAATVAQVAERNEVPFLIAEAEATPLTERGYKWLFRTTPTSREQARDFFLFLRDLNATREQKIKTIAVVHENTLWGQEFGTSMEGYFKEFPEFTLAANIGYQQGTTDVTSEVQRLIRLKPDVVVHASYDAEAILFAKTYRQFNFAPQGVLAIGAAFSSTAFRNALKDDANYFLVREHWALDLAGKNPLTAEVGKLYQDRYNKAMDGTPARAFLAMMTLADAINRAGSTEPAAIQKALQATDLPPSSLIMPWDGVKFDAKGQNTKARGIFVQTLQGKPVTVWPFNIAQAKLVWPKPASE